MKKGEIDCPDWKKGPHGGRQFRYPHYMLLCGCDLGHCETHAKESDIANPFGPKAEPGKPRKCRKHRGKNERTRIK